LAPEKIAHVQGVLVAERKCVRGQPTSRLGNLRFWALAFEADRVGINGKARLRFSADGHPSVQECHVEITRFAEGVPPPTPVPFWEAPAHVPVSREPVKGAPVILFPTAGDPVAGPYFVSWGSHDSSGQTVSGDLTVDGQVPPNLTVTQAQPTQRWVLEVSQATAGAARFTVTVGTESKAVEFTLTGG